MPSTLPLHVEDLDLNGYFVHPDEVAARDAAGPLLEQWHLYSLADAYAPRSPRRYVVDGLLPYPSLSVVYGGPGSLKSMLLADLCLCAALGKRWLEPLPVRNAQGIAFSTNTTPTLWVDFDNGRERSHERFEAVGRGHNAPETLDNIRYVSMPTPWLDASKRDQVVNLAKLVRYVGANLVVIDNLGLVTGDTEENSGEMAQVMGALRWLCEEADCAVVVVHHQRKSSGGAAGIRKGETLRGHSSIEAALDLVLLVERKEGSDSVAVIPTKVRGYLEYAAFGALFTFEHKPGTKDLARARFYAEQSMSAEQVATLKVGNAIINALIAHGPLSQKDVVAEVRDTLAAEPGGAAPAINRVRGILKQLVKDGKVEESAGGRTERVYRAVR